MKAVELMELPEAPVSDDTLILVANPDGPGRATLKEVRGLGVSRQETFFLATASASGVTTDSEGWQDVPQATTPDKRYLWSYTRFTYTDGKVVSTPPAIVGVHGNTGPQGIQGVKGDTGEPFTIARTYPSIADMNAGHGSDGVRVGSFVAIDTGDINDEDNAKLFLKGEAAYTYITDMSGTRGIQGPKGDPGPQGPRGESAMEGFIDIIYPVGSLYWSSRNVNPSTWLGGTWVQIKDKFILAAGDTYNADETGGNANTTLTTANLPSHTHGFTPSGNVSSHSHGLNGHTHSFSAITGEMSANSSGYTGVGDRDANGANRCTKPFSYKYHVDGGAMQFAPSTDADGYDLYMDINHTHTVSGTTVGASGNTANATPSFTGTKGNTEATGSGTAFSNMPPYVVKYCWERVA